MKNGLALLAGLLFGVGLSIAGMTQPAVVLGFLDVFGAWNAQLAFVMAGAVLTAAMGYRLVWRRAQPWLAPRFTLPDTRRIDARLLIGAALFGIGWGLAGYCPGPALASLGSGLLPVAVLATTMALGWWLAVQWPAAGKTK